MRQIHLLVCLSVAPLLAGCVTYRPCRCHCQRACRPAPARTAEVVQRPTPNQPSAAKAPPPARSEALYDKSGAPADLAATAASWSDADLIAFGELHGNPVGAKAELALLQALAAQERPLALAMEFFERDTQADLDAYLAGSIDEETFSKKTNRTQAYASHRPLIEFCKEKGIPVIAANAPRRLVTAYRKAGTPYAEYLASLSEDDRGLLPAETTEIDDAYRAKFMKFMGPERARTFFRAQSLWDDSMADAMARFREENPEHRILLVVGGFHIRAGEGTITKYRLRRPDDEVRILCMDMDRDPALSFTDEDRTAGDLILKVPAPRP